MALLRKEFTATERGKLPFGHELRRAGRNAGIIRSRGELNYACLCFCTLHTNEIPRTDPLVQVDYVRVVDLDIGASKSDICAVRVVTISERASKTR